MNKNLEAMSRIIKEFAGLLEGEKDAIAKRAVDHIIDLSKRKEALLGEFDELAKTMKDGEASRELIQELDKLRHVAADNANALNNIATGVRHARQRLTQLREAQNRAGLYGPGGKALENGGASTVSSKA